MTKPIQTDHASSYTSPVQADIAIVGAGAAGLMAAIAAGRAAQKNGQRLNIIAIDGANKLGAKILVAGGGRCNVTHHKVTQHEYAGGSRNAIRNVLKRFGVKDTIEFFSDLGVHLKREDTGKLFPTTNKARTVLDALLKAACDANVTLRHPDRVQSVTHSDPGLSITAESTTIQTKALILATGGMALPKSGSDGLGYSIAKALGHSITPQLFPALVPLVLDESSPLRALSGLTLPVKIELRTGSNKRLEAFTNSTLLTHFGLSGPAVMDISRHYLSARSQDPQARLIASFLPDQTRETLDKELRAIGHKKPTTWLTSKLPERLALALCAHADVSPETIGSNLTKDNRRALLDAISEHTLPVTRSRGFTHAEATAGGIPLDEIIIKSMSSNRCKNLYLCGEILDVDGRIGGFNFQWAWATGHIAGTAAAKALATMSS